jgi:hypothetical protein
VKLGSDQAKSVLFQDLFAGERYYLALEPHFPYRKGRYKTAPDLEEYPTVRAMLCSEAQFNFHLLNKSLAADRDRLRPATVSPRLLRPIHDAPFKILNIIETAKLTQRCGLDGGGVIAVLPNASGCETGLGKIGNGMRLWD